jgi:hypothetical protein
MSRDNLRAMYFTGETTGALASIRIIRAITDDALASFLHFLALLVRRGNCIVPVVQSDDPGLASFGWNGSMMAKWLRSCRPPKPAEWLRSRNYRLQIRTGLVVPRTAANWLRSRVMVVEAGMVASYDGQCETKGFVPIIGSAMASIDSGRAM